MWTRLSHLSQHSDNKNISKLKPHSNLKQNFFIWCPHVRCHANKLDFILSVSLKYRANLNIKYDICVIRGVVFTCNIFYHAPGLRLQQCNDHIVSLSYFIRYFRGVEKKRDRWRNQKYRLHDAYISGIRCVVGNALLHLLLLVTSGFYTNQMVTFVISRVIKSLLQQQHYYRRASSAWRHISSIACLHLFDYYWMRVQFWFELIQQYTAGGIASAISGLVAAVVDG